jgi:hypothetical protein
MAAINCSFIAISFDQIDEALAGLSRQGELQDALLPRAQRLWECLVKLDGAAGDRVIG